jgi:hypothetical protein
MVRNRINDPPQIVDVGLGCLGPQVGVGLVQNKIDHLMVEPRAAVTWI